MITKCSRNDLVYFSPCYKIVNDTEATGKFHSGKFSIMSTKRWEVKVGMRSGEEWSLGGELLLDLLAAALVGTIDSFPPYYT